MLAAAPAKIIHVAFHDWTKYGTPRKMKPISGMMLVSLTLTAQNTTKHA